MIEYYIFIDLNKANNIYERELAVDDIKKFAEMNKLIEIIRLNIINHGPYDIVGVMETSTTSLTGRLINHLKERYKIEKIDVCYIQNDQRNSK